MKTPAEAFKYFKKATRRNPNNSEAWYYEGYIYYINEDYQNAGNSLERARQPRSRKARRDIGDDGWWVSRKAVLLI